MNLFTLHEQVEDYNCTTKIPFSPDFNYHKVNMQELVASVGKIEKDKSENITLITTYTLRIK